MRVMAGLLAFLVSSTSITTYANTEADAFAWLQTIAAAARQLNYTGTFIYRYGNRIETSRIVHMADLEGEHEKLQALDGTPREIIRNNEEVFCYTPSNNVVTVEKRKVRHAFPGLPTPQQLPALLENYIVRKGEPERVGGFDCQVVILQPKDSYRYGHKLWADSKTGLLIKASMFGEHNQMMDQFMFTQLTIGGPIDRNLLKPRMEGAEVIQLPDMSSSAPAESGWVVKQLPPGFKKIMEIRRMMPRKKLPVNHMVFSDGLAAVSVFVEPLVNVKPNPGLTAQGAMNVYTKAVGEHQVTVVGEVPAMTVVQIGNSIANSKSK